MKITIEGKEVQLTTLGKEPVWVEKGTMNIVGKVADIPNKDITWDTTEEQQIIGRHIHDARVSKGYNTVQFSLATGITRANIQLIEEGKVAVGVQVLARICMVLGVKMADVMMDI